MKDQAVMEEDWQNLIILDACRYDFFKETYGNYMAGDLEKRNSHVSSTGEWLVKNFKDFYDLVYISANPYINKQGLPLKKCNPLYSYDWTASDHFSEIVEVWDKSWNRELGTVFPQQVNEAYSKEKYGKKKTIIHYMQPHTPFLSYGRRDSTDLIRENVKSEASSSLQSRLGNFLRRMTSPRVIKLLGMDNVWRLSELFGLPPQTAIEELWRQGKKNEIHDYYQDNLERVLRAVTSLLDDLEGKTVITADHGEAFGEGGMWKHCMNVHIPSLVEVPWLIVKN